MSDAIFREEPITYFSEQIKKHFLPPDIKMSLVRNKEDNEMTGKLGRTLVKVNDKCQIVIPDTYEKEKWIKNDKKNQIPVKVIQQIRDSQKELSSKDKRDIKYRLMFETLNGLTAREKDFDRYKRMIQRLKKRDLL